MFDKLFKNLKPAIYNYKKNTLKSLDTEKRFFGVMAQDIRAGLEKEGFNPDDFSIVQTHEANSEFDKQHYSVDYVQLIPILIHKIKEMQEEIENLKKQ